MTDATATSGAGQADKEDLREHLLTNLGDALTRLHQSGPGGPAA